MTPTECLFFLRRLAKAGPPFDATAKDFDQASVVVERLMERIKELETPPPKPSFLERILGRRG